jgi:hypothetical protein
MLDFPSAPTVGQKYPQPPLAGVPVYSWDGEKWTTPTQTGIGAVRYDMPQGLTINQMAQGRSNIGSLKKNYIINGGMQVSQENGTTAVGPTSLFPVDQFMFAGTLSAGAANAAQVVSATPAGSPNRTRISVTTALPAPVATDQLHLTQHIEGLRTADLRFGSAVAKTVIIQFGCKGPAGTYSVSLFNNAQNRSYVAEYAVAAGEANTDVIKSVVIPGDVAGTWASDINRGIVVRWGLMTGTNGQVTAGAWGSVVPVGSPNQFNLMGTVGNVFELFDVGLYEGNVAPPFMVPDYPSELALCRRYYTRLVNEPLGLANNAFSTSALRYPVAMRAAPTVAIGAFTVNSGNVGAPGLAVPAPTTTAATIYNGSGNWTLNAQVGCDVLVLSARL